LKKQDILDKNKKNLDQENKNNYCVAIFLPLVPSKFLVLSNGALSLFNPQTNAYTSINTTQRTDVVGLGDALSACANVRGSLSADRVQSSDTCRLFSVQPSSNGLGGKYGPLFADQGTTLLQTNTETLISPVVLCLIQGQGIAFDFSDSPGNFPVYVKDSLLNTNPNFDYGAFREFELLAKDQSESGLVAFFLTTSILPVKTH
jgi:hypothetical protein